MKLNFFTSAKPFFPCHSLYQKKSNNACFLTETVTKSNFSSVKTENKINILVDMTYLLDEMIRRLNINLLMICTLNKLIVYK